MGLNHTYHHQHRPKSPARRGSSIPNSIYLGSFFWSRNGAGLFLPIRVSFSRFVGTAIVEFVFKIKRDVGIHLTQRRLAFHKHGSGVLSFRRVRWLKWRNVL
jgi:hypothetical protein